MRRSLIAVTLLLLAPLASAQVYTWTDAGGTVHYSQAPPAQGVQYKQVKVTGSLTATTPATPPAATTETGESPAETASPDQPRAVADTPENRSRLCTSLTANLAALKGSGPVVVQDNGKPVALDDNQRKQQLDTAQAQFRQYCQTGQ